VGRRVVFQLLLFALTYNEICFIVSSEFVRTQRVYYRRSTPRGKSRVYVRVPSFPSWPILFTLPNPTRRVQRCRHLPLGTFIIIYKTKQKRIAQTFLDCLFFPLRLSFPIKAWVMQVQPRSPRGLVSLAKTRTRQ
jgi:hypothetical protein